LLGPSLNYSRKRSTAGKEAALESASEPVGKGIRWMGKRDGHDDYPYG